jgi:hypothetical protein
LGESLEITVEGDGKVAVRLSKEIHYVCCSNSAIVINPLPEYD